jgi:hypothetical protein
MTIIFSNQWKPRLVKVPKCSSSDAEKGAGSVQLDRGQLLRAALEDLSSELDLHFQPGEPRRALISLLKPPEECTERDMIKDLLRNLVKDRGI